MANDKLKVIAEIIPGGSGFYVVNSDNVGVGNQSLTAALQAGGAETNKKADKTYVDTELAKKSDKTYVDEELAKKADTTTVTALETTVSGKADSSTVSSLQTQVNTNTTKTVDLQSQIDELVLEAGGDSNPEVVQARTDENGTTHTTLKNRIDSSFTEVYNDFSLKNNNLIDVINGTSEFNIYSEYVNGSIVNGQVNTTYTHRIVSKNIFTVENDIMFNIGMDYKVAVQYYNSSGEFISNSGWKTNSYNLIKNENVRLLVAKVNEDTTIIADIKEFSSKVKFEVLEYNTKIINSVIPNHKLITGSYDNSGNFSPNNTRMVSMYLIAVKPSTKYSLVYNSNTASNVNIIEFDNRKKRISNGMDWNSSHILDFTTNINTAYVSLIFAKSDNSDVSDLSISNIIFSEGSYKTDYVLESGGYNSDGSKNTSETVIRCKDLIKVKPGSVYSLSLDNDNSNYQYSFGYVFKNTNIRVENSDWINCGSTVEIPTYCNYIQVTLKKTNDSNIKPYETYTDFSLNLITECEFVQNNNNPNVSKFELKHQEYKYGTQDIAVYNGKIFSASEGKLYLDSTEISCNNGHGNNMMFGNTLHGDFPYLYCPNWNKDDTSCIYVNEVTENSASLVKTIEFPTLNGYLNGCVDEPNNRIYILLWDGDNTWEGTQYFVVADLDGNIISKTDVSASWNCPIIQGMTFYNGIIMVVYGGEFPYAKIKCIDTNGNELSTNVITCLNGELEGIDVDKTSGQIYYANTNTVAW